MRGVIGTAALVLVAIAAFLAFSAFYTVHQSEQVLVLRFGEPIRVVREPGINLKVPFVDGIVRIDRRILDLDMPAQEVIASDQKRLVVDAFARYRVSDPLRFYQTVGTVAAANNRLATFVNSGLRRVLGESTFEQVVRDIRPQLMGRIREGVNAQAAELGISVVDVRIRRADLPEQNSQAIFERMQTERQREAAEIRAQGGEAAQRIRSRADRDVIVIVAEANREAERVRGEGDGERNAIYGQAYGQDQDFFAFYRSMQAYEQGLAQGDTRFVLSPDSEFFRFFGGGGSAAPSAAATGATSPAAATAPAPANGAPAAP
jgi:modulator of FtsH protease HflC